MNAGPRAGTGGTGVGPEQAELFSKQDSSNRMNEYARQINTTAGSSFGLTLAGFSKVRWPASLRYAAARMNRSVWVTRTYTVVLRQVHHHRVRFTVWCHSSPAVIVALLLLPAPISVAAPSRASSPIPIVLIIPALRVPVVWHAVYEI